MECLKIKVCVRQANHNECLHIFDDTGVWGHHKGQPFHLMKSDKTVDVFYCHLHNECYVVLSLRDS